jgi:hypothetical protein
LGIGDWGLGIGPNPQSPIKLEISNKADIPFEKKNVSSDKLNIKII